MSRFIDQIAESPRTQLFLGAVVAVVLAQIAGFYLVVNGQVQKKQARETEIQMQRMAVNDCLQFVPKSTIGSCVRQPGNRAADAGVPQQSDAMMATVVPVGFAYR
jgi:hypothetical protein